MIRKSDKVIVMVCTRDLKRAGLMENPKWNQAGGQLQQIVLRDRRVNVNDRTACISFEGTSPFMPVLQGISGYNMWFALVVKQLPGLATTDFYINV